MSSVRETRRGCSLRVEEYPEHTYVLSFFAVLVGNRVPSR